MKIIITGILSLFCSFSIRAQMVGSDVFLQGKFLELGIAENGSYGSNGNAPTGYHARPDFGITGGPLGFVSDPAKDGWLVSGPGAFDYYGDFFMPGTPQEGWDIAVNGSRGTAYRMSGAASFTGGLTGSNTAYTTSATQTTGVWEGTFGDLSIKQITTQKKDKVYFVARVVLTNTGTSTLSNIYYSRNLDPEPDVCIGGAYTSNKTIAYQPTGISRNCLVGAVGDVISQSYVALGTKDCRARCFITNSYEPTAALANIHSGTGAASSYAYSVGANRVDGACMGIVFNIGSLAPGKTTEVAFAYILKQADLDSALSETAPKFESPNGVYEPYTTFRLCPGRSFPLKIFGGSAYSWTWSPATDLSAASVDASGNPNTDSVLITANGKRTYTVTGINNCDTQHLVFYVDTISFSVPPSVTSPVRYCQHEAAAPLTASGASLTTLLWSAAPGDPETTTAPTPATAVAGTTRYYVRQRSKDSCFSPYTYIEVIVQPTPEPPGVRDTTYCLGATAVPVTATGENIKWYDAATAGTKYPSPPTPSTTGAPSVYYPSQTVDGCESERAALNVNISEINAAFAPSKDSICGDELITVTNTSTNTLNGTAEPFRSFWTFGNGDSSSATVPGISYKKAGVYSLSLMVSNDHLCTDTMQKLVFVAPKPEISFKASDSLICQGEIIDFNGTVSPGYYMLEWDFGDGDIKSYNLIRTQQAFRNEGKYEVAFKAYYSICGEMNATAPVRVTGIPLVNLGPDTTICPGNYSLVLSNQNTVPTGKVSYMWNTGDTTSSLPVRNAGRYALRVAEGECTASDSINVTRGCYLNIPNAFTPSDPDPYNAYFIPRLLASKSVVGFQMQIFNRWGELIFETQNLNGRGWDGTYKGQDQPFGVYVYRIRVSFENGITENYEGNVTLTR